MGLNFDHTLTDGDNTEFEVEVNATIAFGEIDDWAAHLYIPGGCIEVSDRLTDDEKREINEKLAQMLAADRANDLIEWEPY